MVLSCTKLSNMCCWHSGAPCRNSGLYKCSSQQQRNNTSSSKSNTNWNSKKTLIYFAVLMVYLTLISVVILLILFMIPKEQKTKDNFIHHKGVWSKVFGQKNPNYIQHYGNGRIDPRTDLLPVTSTSTLQPERQSRNDYNSKLLDLTQF